MDGKTKGLIVGENFVIDEGEIIACNYVAELPVDRTGIWANNFMRVPEHVIIHLRCGTVVNIAGEMAKPLFNRAQAVLEKRYQAAKSRPGPVILDRECEQTQIIDEIHFLVKAIGPGSKSLECVNELIARHRRWKRCAFQTPDGGEVWQWRYATDTNIVEDFFAGLNKLQDKNLAAENDDKPTPKFKYGCTIQENAFVDSLGRNTKFWVGWYDYPKVIWHWLHPIDNVWVTHPSSVGMPTFPDLLAATEAIERAPNPCGKPHADWRGQCLVGNQFRSPTGQEAGIWIRWTSPDTALFYWLHPIANLWIGDPEQITMPTFKDRAEAMNALTKAPTPPGFSA